MSTKESPSRQPGELGALEFELTDLNTARRSLDELPPGLAELRQLDPNYWAARRRKTVASDRALTGTAIDWLLSLPEPVRPRSLCEFYPRVANTVADAWRDQSRASIMVDRLLNDDRGGVRKGFPDPVKSDLALLLRYLQSLQRR